MTPIFFLFLFCRIKIDSYIWVLKQTNKEPAATGNSGSQNGNNN